MEYKKNYLTEVVFRIDFPIILDFNSLKLTEFRKTIKSEFPILQDIKSGEIIWILKDKDENKLVTMGDHFLSVEFTKYTHFKEFFETTKLVIDNFFTLFPETLSTRVGLRYINNFSLDEEDPLDWSQYINENLIKQINFLSPNNNLSRITSTLDIKEEDCRILFSFGVLNSLYPSKILRKEFTLDYDCSTIESLNKEEILDTVKVFKDKILLIFEHSIKQALKDKMGGEPKR